VQHSGVCGLHEARASLAPVLSPLELERTAGGVQGCGYAAHGFRNSSAGIAPLCKGVCIVNFLVRASSKRRDGAGTGCWMHERPA
jgi:hypothetical protein